MFQRYHKRAIKIDICSYVDGICFARPVLRFYIGDIPKQMHFKRFLLQAKMEVDDLFVDLADGVKLLKLLEIISGEKLGKANNGRMRVHKIENVNKSLAFLHTKVKIVIYYVFTS